MSEVLSQHNTPHFKLPPHKDAHTHTLVCILVLRGTSTSGHYSKKDFPNMSAIRKCQIRSVLPQNHLSMCVCVHVCDSKRDFTQVSQRYENWCSHVRFSPHVLIRQERCGFLTENKSVFNKHEFEDYIWSNWLNRRSKIKVPGP